MPFLKDSMCEILREQYGCTCDRTGSKVVIRNPRPKLVDSEELPSKNNADVCIAIKKLCRIRGYPQTGDGLE